MIMFCKVSQWWFFSSCGRPLCGAYWLIKLKSGPWLWNLIWINLLLYGIQSFNAVCSLGPTTKPTPWCSVPLFCAFALAFAFGICGSGAWVFFVDTGTKTKEVFLVTKNFKFFTGVIDFRFLKGNKINFVLMHYFHNLLTFTRFI